MARAKTTHRSTILKIDENRQRLFPLYSAPRIVIALCENKCGRNLEAALKNLII